MSFWPVPDIMKTDIYELTPEVFLQRGVKLVMLDVDNTISPYDKDNAEPQLISWANEMKAAGLELFILSNNRGHRPAVFADALGIEYIGKAKKPFTKAMKNVLARKNCAPENAALIGDQIYTDTLCAKCVGALAVTVEPIKFTNIFLKLRYHLEAPFRIQYKRRDLKNAKQ